MHNYSGDKSHETFDQTIHECGVRLSDNTGRNFIQLPCHHAFCVKCMESCCSIHVKEGSVTRLTCPDTSCRAALPPPVLRRLLGEEGYARWESLALRRTLDTMPDVVYCPRCNAACVAAGDDAQCPACFFTFCSQCMERRHVGLACVLQKLDDLLLLEQQKRPSMREQMSEEQLLQERRKVEELLSLREMLRSSRQCPSCRMAIAKSEGCNRMVCHCHNCGKWFCDSCNRAISGYQHYANGECGLFEHVNKGMLRAQMNNHDLDEDMEIAEPGWIPALRYPCPTCGAKRTKVGGANHLVCRTCPTQYCTLCWKRIWKASEHYGPSGGCQQRS